MVVGCVVRRGVAVRVCAEGLCAGCFAASA